MTMPPDGGLVTDEARRIAAPLAEAARRGARFIVTSHAGLDGDSAGAAFALSQVLSTLGAEVVFTNDKPPPPSLGHIDLSAFFRPPGEVEGAFDLALLLDTAVPNRLGTAEPLVSATPRKFVVDHHEESPPADIAPEWEVAWIDPAYAAVCVQAAEIVEAIDPGLWSAKLAAALWTGLVTDTGSFQQANTDERALRWGARLVREGADPVGIATTLFESRPASHLLLLGRALASMRVEDGGHLVLARLSRADFEAAGATEDDVEGVIRHLRSVAGCEVAALLRERLDAPGEIKVNLRGKGDADVEAVARALGGGGHKKAAGAEVRGTLDEAERRLREALGAGAHSAGARGMGAAGEATP